MPTRPLSVSMKMYQGVMPSGVARENICGPSDSRIPARPPTWPQPSGMSMNDSARMRKPWKKSVQAEATRPPMKL
jgi:hypothetical protein